MTTDRRHGHRSTEEDLKAVFSRFGVVQTCIVNAEKRHAFIKMFSREDAVTAKEGMETQKPADLQLRVSLGGSILFYCIFFLSLSLSLSLSFSFSSIKMYFSTYIPSPSRSRDWS